MDDLISRQAAIDVMKKHRTIFCDNSPESFRKLPYSDKSRVDEIDNCIAALVNLSTVHQWIPCSERLPDQNGKYLVVGRQKAINILKFDGGRWYGKWGVVAWMPLPDCYQGDGNNEM